MSESSKNMELVRQYVAAFNRGDTETLRQFFTADAEIHGVLGWGQIEEVLPIWRELHASLAVELSIEDMLAVGDTVAVRYTERGQFVGEFRGKKPTGKSYELIAMEWFVCRDGKVFRRWGARDSASQARQTGMSM